MKKVLLLILLPSLLLAQYGKDKGQYGQRQAYGRTTGTAQPGGQSGTLAGWAYSRTVSITGSSAGNLTDYTVRICVDSLDGMQSDFRDIRFTSQNAVLLPHFMESVITGDSTVCWVKVAAIAESGTSIKIWFGNDTCQTDVSSGDAFLVYDDFNDQSIDTNLWAVGSAGQIEETVDGYLHITQGNFNDIYLCCKADSFGAGYAWKTRSRYSSSNWVRESHIGFITSRGIRSSGIAGASALAIQNQGTPDFRWRTDKGGSLTETNLNVTEAADTWYTFEARVDQDGSHALYYFDGTLNATITSNVPQADTLAFQILSYNWTYGKTWQDWVDWVWVRKYVEPEPVVAIEY